MKDVSATGEGTIAEGTEGRRTWVVAVVSFGFILLQSACTLVMTISGVRVLIGLSALAAAAGLHRPSDGFHRDLYRVPMMAIAVVGSVVNLYVIWRVRALRARPAAQWRVGPMSAGKRRAETAQIVLSIITLVLVVAEEWTHLIVHGK